MKKKPVALCMSTHAQRSIQLVQKKSRKLFDFFDVAISMHQ